MKHKLPVLLLLLIVPLVLTACTVQDLPVIGKYLGTLFGPRSTAPVNLNVWGLWEDPEVMKVFIDKYKETHPNVTITYEDRSVMSLIEYKERVYERIKQDDTPDIIRVHDSWVPRFSPYLSTMPKSLMEVKEYQSAFYPVASDCCVIDEKIYAMPLFYDGLMLVYNKDHLKEAGQETPPVAWEEFRRLSIDLRASEGDKLVRAGAAMGAADNIDHFSDILGLMWAQAGVKIPDQLDSVSAQDVLTFYTNFIGEDKVWNKDFPEATVAFAKGQVSMIFVPSWQILDILRAAPTLNIGVAPVPQALADKPASWGSFWVEVIPKTSKNSDAAWEFLKFMAQEEQQLALYQEAAKTRPFGCAYSLSSLGSQLSTDPYIGPLIQMAPYAKSAEIASRAGNRRQVDALKTAVNEVLSGKPVKDALDVAKAEIAK